MAELVDGLAGGADLGQLPEVGPALVLVVAGGLVVLAVVRAGGGLVDVVDVAGGLVLAELVAGAAVGGVEVPGSGWWVLGRAGRGWGWRVVVSGGGLCGPWGRSGGLAGELGWVAVWGG